MANEREDDLTIYIKNNPAKGRLFTDLDTGISQWYPYVGKNYDLSSNIYLTSTQKSDGTWTGWTQNGNVFGRIRENQSIASAFSDDAKLRTAFYSSGSGLYTPSGTLNEGRLNQFNTYGAPGTAKILKIPGATTAPGDNGNAGDTSPELDFSGANLTDIGTPNLPSYFPPEVANNTLRYPYHIISASTDYLQISIETYNRGTQLTRATNDPRFKSKEGVKGDIGTIILPIPSNIQDGNSVGYSDGTLDSLTGAVVGGALGAMDTDFGKKTANQVSTELKNKIGNAFNEAVDAGLKGQILRSLAVQAASIIPGAGNVTPEQLLARQTGGILNPNMELLFNGVTLRSFKFSFKLTPRSKTEADEIKKIIRTLKINMAPQTLTNDNFLRTPNVFQLQYMTGPQPHEFLHRFKTCALTDMSVNYTGEGIYATYSDATPNSMIMDLTFKELEPIYNTDYEGTKGVGY